ncbi:Glucan endo-1,3-alpha-glucosidase agn1 [Ceratobasidium theobromae]|uniref:Glucan endo-1,3-alpha-glucosidase agn1 n=1 Tax=Ceratobasidium theobromae TaxID=1582974 RepID=A0A5N5QAZ2_9AGAM|nr:Glucan endo-1,3-alpha-glucosidase agn1 [Ceratobasidium theobromae]
MFLPLWLVTVLSFLNLGWPLPFDARQASEKAREKFVVAHVIVGNTYPYTHNTWMTDIKLAHANGIDAFALNVGPTPWQKDRVTDAYNAARDSGTGFKMFISLDMTILPCMGTNDAILLRNYITSFASHPAQFRFKNKAFVSTFNGDGCTFGMATTEQGWKEQFTDRLEGENAALFVPSFFMDPAGFKNFSAMDGASHWIGAWPTELTAPKLSRMISFLKSDPKDLSKAPIPIPANLTPIAGVVSRLESTLPFKKRDVDVRTQLAAALAGAINFDSDNRVTANLGTSGDAGAGNIFMTSVSPWFYTHYGATSLNKNWLYRADDWLYNTRWDQLVQFRNKVDIVQVISWNDYGESTYVGPLTGAIPSSTTWINDFDHQGWLNMTFYYATAFKTGQYPIIVKDRIFLFARPHPANAKASNDTIEKPRDFELTEDRLGAVVFASAPGTVTLSADPSKPDTFEVPAGVSKLQIPLVPGQGIAATLTRNGTTVIKMKPDFHFDPNPAKYNYNAATFFAVAP